MEVTTNPTKDVGRRYGQGALLQASFRNLLRSPFRKGEEHRNNLSTKNLIWQVGLANSSTMRTRP